MNSKFIIFCGLDGSGKSTQAKLLHKYFIKKNIDSEYIWLRYPNKFSLIIAAILRLFKMSGYPLSESKKNKGFKNLGKSLFFFNLWKKFLLFDFKIVVKKLQNKNHVIIIDRFVPDVVVDLIFSSENKIPSKIIIDEFFSIIPKNSKIFFINISANVSYSRNHEEDLETLEKKKIIYQKICKLFNISIIDGNKSIETIHQEILHQCGFVK